VRIIFICTIIIINILLTSFELLRISKEVPPLLRMDVYDDVTEMADCREMYEGTEVFMCGSGCQGVWELD